MGKSLRPGNRGSGTAEMIAGNGGRGLCAREGVGQVCLAGKPSQKHPIVWMLGDARREPCARPLGACDQYNCRVSNRDDHRSILFTQPPGGYPLLASMSMEMS
jgi:hypothetical protein